MMMTQLFFIETSKTISVSETRKKDLSNGVGPICLSQLVKKWQKCKDLQPSGKKSLCVSDCGVYQIDPLVRKVYGAESLVTVWSQEGGLVPSDGLQRSPNA